MFGKVIKFHDYSNLFTEFVIPARTTVKRPSPAIPQQSLYGQWIDIEVVAKDQSMVEIEPEANTVSVGEAIRQASVEASLFGAPVMIIALVGAFGWQPMMFWLVLCEWIGLSLGLGWSRATGRKTIVKWPQPSSTVERATTGIAYNGVLGLGIIISIVAWLATRWFFIGAIIATVTPVWLLKHLQIILVLDES